MVTNYIERPQNGGIVCAKFGLNYGPWTSSQTIAAASSYLKARGVTKDVYIGLQKTAKFNAKSSYYSCPFKTNITSIARSLKWMSAPDQPVETSLIDSPNSVKFDACNDLYIFIQRLKGHFLYGDGSYKRLIMCVNEIGKFKKLVELLHMYARIGMNGSTFSPCHALYWIILGCELRPLKPKTLYSILQHWGDVG